MTLFHLYVLLTPHTIHHSIASSRSSRAAGVTSPKHQIAFLRHRVSCGLTGGSESGLAPVQPVTDGRWRPVDVLEPSEARPRGVALLQI